MIITFWIYVSWLLDTPERRLRLGRVEWLTLFKNIMIEKT